MKKNKIISFFFLALMLFSNPIITKVKAATGENVTKYFKQNKLSASYFKSDGEIIEFYNSNNNPKLNDKALFDFKSNYTVKVDVEFKLSEKVGGKTYKPGDWFIIPLDGTLINYPEMKNYQYVNVEGNDILKFRITKINGKPVVRFEFTDKLTTEKYDYFENGYFKIFGKVNNNINNSKSIIIGTEKIVIDFNKIINNKKKPNPSKNKSIKLNGFQPNEDFLKKVYSASATSDIIKYEFNINQELVGKYYLGQTKDLNRKNVILIDKLGSKLKFNKDTFDLEIKLIMPYIGYKYEGDKLVLENGRPVITGINLRKAFLFNFNEKFKKVLQNNRSSEEFLKLISSNKFSYGITNDEKEFYINLGDIGSQDYIINKINSDAKFRQYLNENIDKSIDSELKKYIINDMIKFYGSKSSSAYKALSVKIRAAAEKTGYDTDKYVNNASLVYGENEKKLLESSTFSKNYQTNASITPGAYNTITILKTDAKNKNTKLEGVKFNLYKEGTSKIIQSSTTNNLGIAKFTRLNSNTKYKIVEVKAKDGYDVKSYKAFTSKGYTIDSNGYINIGKESQRQGVMVYATNEKLNHNVILTKYGIDEYNFNKVLQNVKFELHILTSNGWKPIKTEITNELGKIKFNNLQSGKYKFVELETINGFMLNSFKLYNKEDVIFNKNNELEHINYNNKINEFEISDTLTETTTFEFIGTNLMETKNNKKTTNLPQTGYKSNLIFWLVLSFISGITLLITGNKKLKTREF